MRTMTWAAVAALLLSGCESEHDPSGTNGEAPAAAAVPFHLGFPPSDRRVDDDAPGAAASLLPRMAASGSRVYVVWADLRNGSKWDIYFRGSTDGGSTWGGETRLDSGPAGLSDSLEPQIACSGDSVYVTWMDRRNGTYYDIYFQRSLDAGSTWLASDVRLDADVAGSKESALPRIACDGTGVYVAWMDKRNGKEDIYFRGSSDGGTTWTAESRLDIGAVPGTSFSMYPRIVCSGSNVYVAWHDDRSGFAGIYFNRSIDGGATWLAPDVRVDDSPAATAWPALSCDGDRVCVAWLDYRNGVSDVHARNSSDAGTTWTAASVRVDTDEGGAGESYELRLAQSGDRVIAIWQDWRTFPPALYARRSVDGGATWETEVRLDSNGEVVAGHVVASGERIFVAWLDYRSGSAAVYVAYSGDAGATWSADERVDRGPDGAAVEEASVAAGGDRMYVVWQDDRNGNFDVYFTASDP